MSLGKRLKAIIKEERMSQRGFSEEIGFSLTAIEQYISDKRTPSGELFIAMGTHKVFKKYTIWLLTGDVDPNSGQVSPDFSTQEQCGLTVANEDDQKKA